MTEPKMTEPKMTEKPPTMRALTEQVVEGVAALVRDVERRNSAKTTTAAPKPYTEADALADCINALQRLNNEMARPSSGYSAPYSGSSEWDTGARVLRYLAARFNVNLIEIQRPACERLHIGDVAPDALFNALTIAAQPAR